MTMVAFSATRARILTALAVVVPVLARVAGWVTLAVGLAISTIRRRPSLIEMYARCTLARLYAAHHLIDTAANAIGEHDSELHVTTRWGIPNPLADEGDSPWRDRV